MRGFRCFHELMVREGTSGWGGESEVTIFCDLMEPHLREGIPHEGEVTVKERVYLTGGEMRIVDETYRVRWELVTAKERAR